MDLKEIKSSLQNNIQKFVDFCKRNSCTVAFEHINYLETINRLEIVRDELENKEIIDLFTALLITYDKKLEELNYETVHYDKGKAPYNKFQHIIDDLADEMKRFNYLKIIRNKNINLVGSNGSGKSAFASFMKDSLSDKITVIPAQKYLYYHHNPNSIEQLNKKRLMEKLNINYIKKFFEPIGEGGYHYLSSELEMQFTVLITSTVNEYVDVSMKKKDGIFIETNTRNGEYNYKKFLYIWDKLIPKIKWYPDFNKRNINPKINNNDPYDINNMSDGEKAVIYYVLSILSVKENSIIIIDEPETYLNPSMYKKMWDLLEKERDDCKFIYISHSIEFINSRYNQDLYWIKSFDGNTNWQINPISEKEKEKLPTELLTELLGIAKPIIFCEGNHNSLDYKVYSKLFDGVANIIPVKGHLNVVAYTKSYNNLPNKNNIAFGIIDRDQHSKDQLSKWREDNIFPIEFNEIEMLLLNEEVMEAVLNANFYDNKKNKEKIATFKNKFLEILKKRKRKILDEFRKNKIDSFLKSERVEDETKKTDEIINDITQKLQNMNIEQYLDDTEKKITIVWMDKNYCEALKICPFKNMINEAEKIFNINSYTEVAITQIANNSKLCKILLDKYFPFYDKLHQAK